MPHHDPSRLFEIAALERPLTPVERLEVGLEAHLDRDHVAHLLEYAAFERPLAECEIIEIDLALQIAI